MATNSALNSSSQLLENERHNYTTKQRRATTEEVRVTCSGSLVFSKQSSSAAQIQVILVSPALPCDSAGLLRASEPHLKLDWEDKPGRTALQEPKVHTARGGTLRVVSGVSRKLCSTASLSGLKWDFPPKQLHKNCSLLGRSPAASSRSRICLLTEAQKSLLHPGSL